MKKINVVTNGRKRIWLWLAVLTFVSSSFSAATTVQAAEALVVVDKVEGQEKEAPLLAPALDQQVAAGTKKIVHYTIKNLENKAIKLQTGMVNATVSQSGQIMYDIRELPPDGERKLLADFIKIESEIAIDAKKEYQGQFEIEMPAEPFAGIVSGAILFFEAGTDQVVTKLPVQLQEGEHLEAAKIRLTDLGLLADDGEEQLAANLHNASLNNGEKVLVKAVLKNQNEKVMDQRELDIPLFPSQSQFYWRLPFDYQQLKKGSYQLEVELIAPDNEPAVMKQTVEVFEKDGKKQLRLPLEDHVEEQQRQRFWFVLAGAAVFIAMGIGLWWYKKKQESAQQESQNASQSTKKVTKKRRKKVKVVTNSSVAVAKNQAVSEAAPQLVTEPKADSLAEEITLPELMEPEIIMPEPESILMEPESTMMASETMPQQAPEKEEFTSDAEPIVVQPAEEVNEQEETADNAETAGLVEADLTAAFSAEDVSAEEHQKEAEKLTREERLAKLRRSRKHMQKKKRAEND